ncbi:toprim domain-containing protein [Methylomonas sp. 2BW1-5-20]|uniref:toprim domain-containing protein n=1 Tax=Methylomonas sp. 2BW1-5-20 TaxID=3376686 RepID=UPI00404F7942
MNSDKSRTMSAADKARITKEQQRRDAKRRRMQDIKAAEAVTEYERAQRWPFTPSAYMVRKELSVPVGARLGRFDRSARCVDGEVRRIVVDDVLLIPIRNRAGYIRNLQYIFPEVIADLGRDKTFIAGAELAGCFSCIGKCSAPMFLAEGWATAVSLFEDTGCRVFICFSATNLMAVGKTVRELHQDAELIFCADNDEKTAGNPGVTKANEAAAAIDATVYVPPIAGDYNDFKIRQRRLESERG